MKPHILLIDLYTWQFQIEWQILLATKLSAVQQPWHSSLIAGKKVIDQDGYLTADEGIFVRLLPFSKQNMVFFIVLSTKLFNIPQKGHSSDYSQTTFGSTLASFVTEIFHECCPFRNTPLPLGL